MDTEPMVVETPFAKTYGHIFAERPPAVVDRGESKAPIFAAGRGFMDGFDLTMQLQVGCPGGCLYCYVPPAFALTPASVRGRQGRTWGFVVRDKVDVPRKFREAIAGGRLAGQKIYWSGITDPFAASPTTTRQIWTLLAETPSHLKPTRVVVQTRFRADRDADLMAAYSQSTSPPDGGPAALVSFSLGTDRNDLIRAWERATPLFERRMRSIRVLREAGVAVVATLSPLGLWNDLRGTLAQLKAWGVAYITALFFKTNQTGARTPRRFLECLSAEYPELLDPSWQSERVQEMVEVFGEDRVLIGKSGFASLASPQLVCRTA